MEKVFYFIAVVIFCIALIGCNAEEPPVSSIIDDHALTDDHGHDHGTDYGGLDPHEMEEAQKSLELVNEMMALDYESMPLSEFHDKIQNMANNAGSNLHKVISGAYDACSVYDEIGTFITVDFQDAKLKKFMETTLNYSSGQLFGEPVHHGSIPYTTNDGVSAEKLYDRKNEMSAKEWYEYTEKYISDIRTHATLFYKVKYGIADMETITVKERDDVLNGVCKDIDGFIVKMTKEDILGDEAEKLIDTKLEEVGEQYSGEKIQITCERESLNQAGY